MPKKIVNFLHEFRMLKVKNRPYFAALNDHCKLQFAAISPLSFMFHDISVSYNQVLYTTVSILISQ